MRPHLETLQDPVGLLVQVQVDRGQAQVIAIDEVHAPHVNVAWMAIARGAHHQALWRVDQILLDYEVLEICVTTQGHKII